MHETVTEKLARRKLCAKSMPKVLNDKYKDENIKKFLVLFIMIKIF